MSSPVFQLRDSATHSIGGHGAPRPANQLHDSGSYVGLFLPAEFRFMAGHFSRLRLRNGGGAFQRGVGSAPCSNTLRLVAERYRESVRDWDLFSGWLIVPFSGARPC
jgi:hypothetical protein